MNLEPLCVYCLRNADYDSSRSEYILKEDGLENSVPIAVTEVRGVPLCAKCARNISLTFMIK